MKRADKLIFGILFGASFPMFFMMLAVVIWFYSFREINVFYFVIPGLLAGVIIDIISLKKLIDMALILPVWVLIGFYLFLNICVFGFFMGFPVFNLVMGVIAGYYFGIKINYTDNPSSQVETLKRNVPIFTALVMYLICLSTALLALSEKTIGDEVQHMLGLNFKVTRGMITAIILVGGTTLIVAQYYFTKIVMTITIKVSN